MAAKLTGRAGSVTIKGISIPITSWSAKGTKELADATDSSNFDSNTGQLWKAQLPGAVAVEVSLEGNFDLTTTDTNIIQLLKQDPPVDILLAFNATTKYVEALFDLSDVDVKVTVPGATMVTFSANAKSNGVVTIY